jgi:hypothetical protein
MNNLDPLLGFTHHLTTTGAAIEHIVSDAFAPLGCTHAWRLSGTGQGFKVLGGYTTAGTPTASSGGASSGRVATTFRVLSFPATGRKMIGAVRSSGGAKLEIYITSSQRVEVVDNAGNAVWTSAVTVNADQIYCVVVQFTSGGGTAGTLRAILFEPEFESRFVEWTQLEDSGTQNCNTNTSNSATYRIGSDPASSPAAEILIGPSRVVNGTGTLLPIQMLAILRPAYQTAQVPDDESDPPTGTPVGTELSFEALMELDPDGDATYVRIDTPGSGGVPQGVAFVRVAPYEDVGIFPADTVHRMQAYLQVRRTAAAGLSGNARLMFPGALSLSSSDPGTTYARRVFNRTTTSTGGAITPADLVTLEIGYSVDTIPSGGEMRWTWGAAVVEYTPVAVPGPGPGAEGSVGGRRGVPVGSGLSPIW